MEACCCHTSKVTFSPENSSFNDVPVDGDMVVICFIRDELGPLAVFSAVAPKTSMNSSPGVIPSGMTVPKGIGTMVGNAAIPTSLGASFQLVPRSSSAGRGISGQIASGISIWFWIT